MPGTTTTQGRRRLPAGPLRPPGAGQGLPVLGSQRHRLFGDAVLQRADAQATAQAGPRPALREAWLRTLLHHVTDALQVLHDKQCYHRDVAPDNIPMLAGNKPLLLDFGAARRVIGDMTQALTVILKPGYAPIEQYGDMPNMSQGPWTDLYALASVVYFIITDKVPPAALSRLICDTMVPRSASAQERYSPGFLAAIDAALGVRPEQRPQSVAEFRSLLGGAAAPRAPAVPGVKAGAATLGAVACPLRLPDGASGCPVMVAIPGASYRMGSVAGDPNAAPEELGAAPATVAPFEMSAHEVSVGQWELCVADGACPATPATAGAGAASSRLPVVNVSWDASMAYIAWLSKKTGRTYRLPSELEWEYAARAGAATLYPCGDKIGADNAHCGQCASHLDYRQRAPTGSFRAHGGLYDMAGNVYEWVSDCWQASYAEAARAGPARQDAACKATVQKGGAYDSTETDVRAAARTFGERGSADPRVGFRVSRQAGEQPPASAPRAPIHQTSSGRP